MLKTYLPLVIGFYSVRVIFKDLNNLRYANCALTVPSGLPINCAYCTLFFFTRTKLPLNFHTNDNCVELHLTSPRTHHAAVQTGTQNRSVFFLPTSTITCMCCAPESCAVMGFSFTIYSLELHYISLCDATPTVFLCCKEPKRIRCFHC